MHDAANHDTDLIAAVTTRDVGAVERLLTAGADPNTLTAKGERILYSCITPGVGFMVTDTELRILKALLAAGADPKLDGVGERMVDLAWGCVTAALEANYARSLASLLGVSRSS